MRRFVILCYVYSARQLVLDLVTALPYTEFSARQLCRGGEVMELSEASVRMASARLHRSGVLARPRRGRYRLHPGSLPSYGLVRGWRDRVDEMIPWNDGWQLVHADASNLVAAHVQTELKQKLFRLGYRQLTSTLYVRPNNMRNVDAHLQLTRASGPIPGYWQFTAHEVLAHNRREILSLWDTEFIRQSRRRMIRRLNHSLHRAGNNLDETFCRESLELGHAAIATIVTDPLLPTELVEVDTLADLIDRVDTYQRIALKAWVRVLGS